MFDKIIGQKYCTLRQYWFNNNCSNLGSNNIKCEPCDFIVKKFIPLAVAGNCNIVDILSKVEWWRTLVGLVIESPVGLVAEVPQARVRNCQPRFNRLGNIDPSTIEWCCRWRHTILVFVHTIRKNRLETCFYRARIVTCSVTAFAKWTGINFPFPEIKN